MSHITSKKFSIVVILSVSLVLAALLSVMIGPVFVHPVTIIQFWLEKLSFGLLHYDIQEMHRVIIMNIRMPRVIVAILVGMGLSASGAAMQGLFRNPMAEPYVLGMSSGAAAGASAAIVLGIGGLFGVYAVPVMAFITAVITIFVVYSIAHTDGKVPTETLLLSGIAVGFFLQAAVSFLKLIAPMDALRDVVLWLMGSFAGVTWSDAAIIVVPILAGLFTLLILSRELNAFQFGEETAMHIGIEVELMKRILLTATALITAVAVSTAGIIGFTGLVIPHIARMLVGADQRIQLPVAAVTGGIFLVLADTLARSIARPAEIPIGIITAAVGAPYFVYLLRRRKHAVGWW
ncbi:MAG TPA: iron chelate uptake ABC transporter family permease subunit [Chitinispirillaceae bacterium]|nr:iron chelate uptake ABC transporter family permease subunit [Chitinispirillaceae bacterium]